MPIGPPVPVDRAQRTCAAPGRTPRPARGPAPYRARSACSPHAAARARSARTVPSQSGSERPRRRTTANRTRSTATTAAGTSANLPMTAGRRPARRRDLDQHDLLQPERPDPCRGATSDEARPDRRRCAGAGTPDRPPARPLRVAGRPATRRECAATGSALPKPSLQTPRMLPNIPDSGTTGPLKARAPYPPRRHNHVNRHSRGPV